MIRKIESVLSKYNKKPGPPPPPSAGASTSIPTQLGKDVGTPSPRSKKEDPNIYCKILKLEGTTVNNKKSTALQNYAATTFGKTLTEVILY